MFTTTQQITPAVWIGCLACYSRPCPCPAVGDWFDPADIDVIRSPSSMSTAAAAAANRDGWVRGTVVLGQRGHSSVRGDEPSHCSRIRGRALDEVDHELLARSARLGPQR